MLLQTNQWFALQVRARSEHSVSESLRSKGYEEFMPMAFSQGAVSPKEPLFPGYVFCRLNSMAHGRVVTTPGVIRVVSFGGRPAPIDPEEISSIRVSIDSGAHGYSCHGLQVGERIRVEAGPLKGVVGTIASIRGKNRLVVSVSTLMKSIILEIDPGWIGTITRLQSKPSIDLTQRSA